MHASARMGFVVSPCRTGTEQVANIAIIGASWPYCGPFHFAQILSSTTY